MAYDMRISDWSSDVCSSDLGEKFVALGRVGAGRAGCETSEDVGGGRDVDFPTRRHRPIRDSVVRSRPAWCLGLCAGIFDDVAQRSGAVIAQMPPDPCDPHVAVARAAPNTSLPRAFLKQLRPGVRLVAWRGRRSEEHTSELQSLMRISYSVFCLD